MSKFNSVVQATARLAASNRSFRQELNQRLKTSKYSAKNPAFVILANNNNKKNRGPGLKSEKWTRPGKRRQEVTSDKHS